MINCYKIKFNISQCSLEKKNNLNTLILYFNLMIKWGKSQKKNFIIANMLMLVVAAVTSLYPIAIDYSFNALNNKNVTNLMYITYRYYCFNFFKRNFLFLSNCYSWKNI